jgi:DeoR/GlpR family transcriptional regulator of sugar metabolism
MTNVPKYYTLDERKEMILEKLKEEEEVTISFLSNVFNVSRVTLKPAIEVLVAEGKIKPTYRGRSIVYEIK